MSQTFDERYPEVKKTMQSPGGLQKFATEILPRFFLDPTIRVETIKDVNLMCDVIVLVYDRKPVFELQMPWNSDPAELSRRYSTIVGRECYHKELTVNCETCFKELRDEVNALRRNVLGENQ